MWVLQNCVCLSRLPRAGCLDATARTVTKLQPWIHSIPMLVRLWENAAETDPLLKPPPLVCASHWKGQMFLVNCSVILLRLHSISPLMSPPTGFQQQIAPEWVIQGHLLPVTGWLLCLSSRFFSHLVARETAWLGRGHPVYWSVLEQDTLLALNETTSL